MYLGLKEMAHEKLRYTLLTSVLLLIALVVFCLAGLASGLAYGNRQAVDAWQATSIYLNKDANQNLSASQLKLADDKYITGNKVEPIATLSGTLRTKNDGLKTSISALGTARKSFLMPKVTSGHQIDGKNQIIISADIYAKGYRIGDRVRIGTTDKTVKIVGVYAKNTYSIAPTIYTDVTTLNQLRSAPITSGDNQPVNGFVTRRSQFKTDQHGELEKLTITKFIQKLPGYQAQQLTLNTMIYFLFVMALAIIGIFMFILTLQKQALFGVLKVQGIGTKHILAAILTQSMVMAIAGIALGLLITVGLAQVMPAALPFTIDWLQMGIYSAALLVAAVLGALLSWRTIAKIDPVVAIG
ncbi:ABC transporter permease [Lactiplantibacillus mudanjiangensis]|uniref:Putative hemin transport system permease protein HrtB n=1 Tax=Lactiplantibacillus mudanjiangensis TaxID=1296538 RepID=A0A660E6L2_9LACO|nr:FtsX-like permease family protein [Lactiplantibacillus mudanjiangensis]VDG18613.1 ABC transporter, permease protein (putative) [Lactobacillus plantarum JDM1] [Lactiplantibacillus mudanjiangensis]VDG25878.1 ABC transporter, permease protein (putative) [Lactobacillus plantarum JDM1] [Lactiplantibacillus mudanjiangensis]VDG28690.1 ABC transporter, permease protein (putative) [Lactobacillus plantarum JDM1] [Lactiplantibacillus mudanjiangensis]VDG33712.1 ABC transporter, permease protein (putativ